MKERIYMDHAATTYLDPAVKKAMEKFWIKESGNPSSIYKEGRQARQAVNLARKQIAGILGSRPEEIIFTMGGTESDNLAILGTVANSDTSFSSRLYPQAGSDTDSENEVSEFACKSQSELSKSIAPHVITSKFEHHAVLNTCKFLENRGVNVTYLDVGEQGIVNLDDVRKALRPETILVSVMYANNEIGTIQPIAEIGKIIKNFRKQNNSQFPYFHTDACQASGYLNMDVNKLGVDLLTANGSKVYGPKGIGLLYVRSGIKLSPLMYGGEQERKLRPGTENVSAIIGLAEALKIAEKNKEKKNKRLSAIRNYFIKRLTKEIPNVFLNGHAQKRLPNNINVSVLGAEGESIVLYLDEAGVACSTGSACTSESLEPSHVITALGKPYEYGHGSLRFSLGRKNTKKDIDRVMNILPEIVEKLRSISAFNVS